MSDAEIIPIGTRGRPGRGSGRSRPSSAARSLARATGSTRPGSPSGALAAAREDEPIDLPDSRRDQLDPAAEERSPATTRERSPLDAVPVGEWLAALQAAAAQVYGERWEPRVESLLGFLRRRVTGDYTVDEYGFDPEVFEKFLMAALRPIAEKWFRIEVRGIENIPADGGALVVSNHSGTIPVDALMTMVSIHQHTGRSLRALGADLVFRLPVVSSIARKGGATLACNEDAERMLRNGELVGVWPEGFKGIGKPFSERYRLQRFGRGGFVAAAVRTGVPIVPLSVVGAEEIYPLVGNVPLLARLLGVPYIPITPLFPLLGPLGLLPLPSKWILEFGEPVRTDALEEGAADDPMMVFNVTDQVRETIQQTLYQLLTERGSAFSR